MTMSTSDSAAAQAKPLANGYVALFESPDPQEVFRYSPEKKNGTAPTMTQ